MGIRGKKVIFIFFAWQELYEVSQEQVQGPAPGMTLTELPSAG